MNRLRFHILVLSMMTLIDVTWAGVEKTEPQLRLELDLVDGSRVIGTPSIESVPMQTAYAKMDVPLKEIRTIRIDADHETASVDLRNGDKLKGVVNLEPIKLETVFGKVSVGIEHIRNLRVVLAGGALPEALKRRLVLYYSFDKDESGKVTDKSGKGHDGEVKGANWTKDGKVGGGYGFDGRSCITADGSKLPAGNSSRTVSLWLYKEHGSGNIAFAYGAHKPNESFGIALVSLNPNNAYVYVKIGWKDLWGITDKGWNKWVHVCAVYDESSGKMTIYGNGVMENSKSMSPNTPNISIVYVGRPNFEETYWKGIIDEVMIFDRALSEAEVKQIYDAQK